MTSKWVREYLPSLPVHNVSEEARERAAFVAADREYRLRAEIARLREAIRRLAEQDATLSVVGGSVTVTMDATLTAEEREAINMSRRILVSEPSMNPAQRAEWAITLSRLLDRTGFEQ